MWVLKSVQFLLAWGLDHTLDPCSSGTVPVQAGPARVALTCVVVPTASFSVTGPLFR